MAGELFTRPENLPLLSEADLTAAHDEAHREFTRVHGDADNWTPEALSYAEQLAGDLDAIKAEQAARALRATLTTEAERDGTAATMERLAARVNGPGETTEPTGGTGAVDVAEIVAAAGQGFTDAFLKVFNGSRTAPGKQLASLSAAAGQAPDQGVAKTGSQLTMYSNVDVPRASLVAGAEIQDMDALVAAVQIRASSLPEMRMGEGSPRHPVATIRNEFSHTLDERTNPGQVEAILAEVTKRGRQEALLAGGGWCAPSEVRYDLFNISDVPSGIIDLPTVGVTRGGVRYPVSPSIADIFYTSGASNAASGLGGFAFPMTNGTVPWLWSEADDIATVTGSPNKPTLRVPCATFNETRLELYGITLTAGNLTDSAYPEATANFLRLIRNAYEHTKNARLIALMLALSSSAIAIGGANKAAFNTVLSGVELAAVDYRQKFGMSATAILELVIPEWILPVVRADLAWRTAVELEDVTDQMIRGFFATRGIAAQFVSDWQVRGAGGFGNPAALPGGAMTAWPTSVDFLLYAAGTFVHGSGMTLDLGVVRDSILNAENDFTAAWMEEAHLVAKVGHESRRYTATFSVNGAGVLGQTLGAQI